MRQNIIFAVDEAVNSGARLFKACDAIQLCERRLRRWRKSTGDARKGGYHAIGQRLSEKEKDDIIAALDHPEVKVLPIKVAHATLMDKGIYLASASSFVRVVAERMPEKRRRTSGFAHKRPELVATAPKQIWCWDITWLNSAYKDKYFYLYMVIDLFSRKVVAWEVYSKEDGQLARSLFATALQIEKVQEGQITVHSDNGRPMRSNSLRSLFDLLMVKASFGRPHTSNDNAFAESLFATFKSRVMFPEFFPTIESARDFCVEFFTWYNCFHLHSSLDFVTPETVHNGLHQELFNNRNALLQVNREHHPSRHGGREKVFHIPAETRLKHKVLQK